MPPNWHAAMDAHWQRQTAERLAMPPRPEDPPPGHVWARVVVEIVGGQRTEIELRIPAERGRRRPRSDQSAVAVDGGVVAEREAVTSTLGRIRRAIGRRMTRAQRDEADRIEAGLL